ncbi:stage II sporulation protein M [Bacillus pumilus]|uniref:stage II sporulation protein M n=1 Tax=Bacillus pumilus TaxID=1408 RepID=UPI000DDFE319|nr:stage II sporulation protein M [Bacillus pumilus]
MNFMKNMSFLLSISTILFGLAFVCGYLTGDHIDFTEKSNLLSTPVPSIELSIDLFINNIIVCFFLMSGIFLFSIPTILLLLLNGFFLGIGVKSLMLLGLNGTDLLMKLFPHGILEIPAFLLSASIGFLGLTFYFNSPRNYLKKITKSLILVVVFVFIAALIEGFITVSL